MAKFEDKFDFLYVPFDFKFWKCVGFVFINMVKHEDAVAFTDKFEDLKLEGVVDGKEIKVNWASPHQGLEAHVEHFKNSPVMHSDISEEYKPIIFKDGQRVEFPAPTVEIKAPRTRPGHVTGRRHQFVGSSSEQVD